MLHETSYCRFGKVIVVAFVKSTTKIQCSSPPQVDVGQVDVEVSMGDNVAFFASSLQFNYLENVIVSSISPRFGPMAGSTLIIIEGNGFLDTTTLSCKFGRVDPSVSAGTFINSNKISCVSPPNEMGPTKIEVSVNGIDYSDSGQRFEYVENLRIMNLRPATGPTDGGTEIVIRGKHFIASPFLRCSFGDVIVVAEYLDIDSISCTPTEMVSGKVEVGVSNNGVDFEYSNLNFVI